MAEWYIPTLLTLNYFFGGELDLRKCNLHFSGRGGGKAKNHGTHDLWHIYGSNSWGKNMSGSDSAGVNAMVPGRKCEFGSSVEPHEETGKIFYDKLEASDDFHHLLTET